MRNYGKWAGALALACFVLGTSASAQSVWESKNPLTQANDLKALTWTGTRYVAVGNSGTIVTSLNGTTWSPSTSGVGGTLYGVANNGSGVVVAVGISGTILRSTNHGASWNTIPVVDGNVNTLYGITWSSFHSRFIAVGATGTILTSADGQTWSTKPTPTTQILYGVAVSNAGRVAVVGVYTSNDGALTSDDASTFTQANASTTLYSVAWVGSEFIGVGGNGAMRASSNGEGTWSWSGRTSIAGTTLLGICPATTLVIVGSAGKVRHSNNATSWTEVSSPTAQSLNAVVWSAGGGYLAVGSGGVVLSSSDGSNWTQTSSYASPLYGVTTRFGSVGDTGLVAVGNAGIVLTSPDGVAWTKRTQNNSNHLYAAASGGTILAGQTVVAVGANGTILTATTNLGSWSPRTSGVGVGLFAVAGNSTAATPTFVAVGQNTILFSTNAGATWAVPTTLDAGAASAVFNGVASNPAGNIWVAVAGAGYITRATTAGGTWTAPTSSTPNRLNAIVWCPAPLNMFVAVGASGTIITSTNGTTWNLPATLTGASSVNFLAVTVTTANVIVATGDLGEIWTSPNGTSWTRQTSGFPDKLSAVKWDGKVVAAVGASGRILTSLPAALPPVPTPQIPGAAAVNVPVNPILTWSQSSGAVTYGVQVSTHSDFSDTLINTATTGTANTIAVGPLAVGTKHYWRVSANGTMGSSAWSGISEFTVIPADSSAPILIYPAHNDTGVGLSINFTWRAYTGATAYRFQVSTDPLFGTTLLNDSGTTTNRTIPTGINPSTVYYWRVYARLATGVTAWSAPNKFTTTPPVPLAPVTLAPTDGFSGFQLTGGMLSWSSSSGATGYRVQVSTSPTFASYLRDTLVQGANSLTLPTLSVNGVYYWRVSAVNAAGPSAPTATRWFTTATIPAKPNLVSPANATLNVDVFTDVTWSAVSNAQTYHVQISTDSNTAPTFMNDSTVPAGTLRKNVGQLADQTRYYWRVAAKNPAGITWSNRGFFNSGSVPTVKPAAPILSTPANYDTLVSASAATFTWAATATAKYYRIEISLDPSFSTLVATDSITTTSKTVTTLIGGVEYFWRVKAGNNVSYGDYSEIRVFETVATVPGIPVLLLPEQFSTDASVTPTLTWSAVPGATYYRLELSTTNTFTVKMVNDSVTSTSRVVAGPLANLTPYFWRVRAGNGAGLSAYPQAFRFTTGIAPLPPAPNLVSPIQFSTGQPLPVTLKWNIVSVATSYLLQVSTSNSFATFVLQDSSITDTTRTLVNLTPGNTYYWRVYSKNSAGNSVASSTFRFSTEPVAILPGVVAFRRGSQAGSGLLRFGLVEKQRVTIRMFNTGGRSVAQTYDAVLEPGYHAIPFPAELQGSFFLVDFKAGALHQTLKVHP